MGYDISYHPIKETEMNTWFFNVDFVAIIEDNYSGIAPIIQQYALDDFYAEKYKDILQVAANTQPDEPFENTYGYYLAVIQGLMGQYFYTRGSAFSFLIQEKPYFKNYTKPWSEMLTYKFENPIQNELNKNYSSGVYIPADKVIKLREDYEAGGEVKQDLDNYYSHGRINIFIKALKHAQEHECGLLEATEVVEPNPLELEDTICYSNLLHCDIEGALLYQQAAQEQIREIEQREQLPEGEFAHKATYEKITIPEPPSPPQKEKKGFFKRLFG